ncbi:MAG: phosphate signaling complex protein PhoU [Thermoflexales bacterium]|nr:phosphate signaling complex protein PhoU [Thermoflexales bacterium]MDW8351342.1 phosphate signaling complex protein PhoU [Anaerolineae bacterium]
MPHSTRTTLDRNISAIIFELRRIAGRVEEQIEGAVRALQERNVLLAHRVVELDQPINALRYKVEELCQLTIATQQPTAHDLRLIIAAIHVAGELERMADHAAGIANIALRLGDQPALQTLVDIPRMKANACDMLRQGFAAFVEGNVALAHRIMAQDDALDAMYVQSLRVLLTYMMQDPAAVPDATYLLWVAHNLERIGDRAVNLCERAIFAVEGLLGNQVPQEEPTDRVTGA